MNLKWTGILAGALLLTAAYQARAIEGLKLSLQCSNVVLSWPSSDTNNEYFLVQYRPTLSSTDQWQTIGSWIPAESGTNQTTFVHSNIVQYANCFESSLLMQNESSLSEEENLEVPSPFPLAMRADGSSSAVPLNLYPPGFDFTGFLLLDPVSGEWVNGNGYSMQSFSETLASLDPEDPGVPGDPQEGGGTTIPPETGFYRVVRHGVTLLGVTNGMTLSGTVTIPIEAGNDSGTLEDFSINEGGSPLSDLSTEEAPFFLPLAVVIDTTQMSNGVHQIHGSASWYIPGTDNPHFQANSQPLTVNVYNEISFPNWMPEFGQIYDSLVVSAESAHTNANWFIDVYGANAGYIGTFQGHTDDGHIEAVWNLVGPPPANLSYANEPYFQFMFETDYDDGQAQAFGPQAAASRSTVTGPKAILKNWDHWTAKGDWVVANQLYWETWVGGENLNNMTDGFEHMAEEGYGLTVRPTHVYHEAFRIHYNDGNETTTWQSFRQALYHPNSRNLFYSGHGGNNGIGYDSSNTNIYIPRTEIETMLHTVPSGQTNRHGFRFVFIDGCSTAKGNLCEAFGIIRKKNLSSSYYDDAGLRRTAFVGWNDNPAAGYASHLVNPDHWKFIQNFQYLWLSSSKGIRECLDDADKAIGPAGANNIDPDDLTVYGCRNLGPNQHNGL